jgi:peptidoglycan/LPS O-acetylase OafA/YrhL
MKLLATKHFDYMDGLRGFLAVYVVCHHFLGWNMPASLPPRLKLISSAFAYGHPAVCAFIVLSGFSLMLPVTASPDGHIRGGFWGYLRRRGRRILPAYYAALALSVAAVPVSLLIMPDFPNDVTAASVVSHLLLIHNLVPGQHGTINMALWSVATEWQIYFLFPLVLLPVWRRCGSAALLATAFGLGAVPQVVLAPGSDLLHACPWFLGLFALGMVAAVVVDGTGPAVTWPARPTALGIAALAGYCGLKLIRPGSDIGSGWASIQWLKDGAVGLACACLLVACTSRSVGAYMSTRRRNPILALLGSPVGRWFGLLSYSLYATHCAVLRVMRALVARAEFGPSLSFVVMAVVGIPVAVGLAYLTSRWFEVPYLSQRGRPPENQPNPMPHPTDGACERSASPPSHAGR